MKLAFDHLVHFIDREPAEAVEKMHQSGFHAVPGGRHEFWGTYNALCYFGLSYIEFLAIENIETAKRSDNGLIVQFLHDLPKGEGFGQVAIRTQHIEELADRIARQGIGTNLMEGSRTRTDGSVIRWKMLFLESDYDRFPFPFFIQWEQGDEERLQDLQKRNIIRPHPIGDARLKEVAIAVRDLESVTDSWSKLFHLESSPPFTDEVLQARCQRLKLEGGDLLFCQPLGAGIVEEALTARGERPFMVTLEGTDREECRKIWGGTYRLQK